MKTCVSFRRIVTLGALPLFGLSLQPANAAQNGPEEPALEQSLSVRPAEWDAAKVRELLDVIARISSDGLDPADYRPERLRAALAANDPALSAIARATALKLARDMYEGTSAAAGSGWHLRPEPLDYSTWLDETLTLGQIGARLNALLPQSAAYLQLRGAYTPCLTAHAPYCDVLKVNLDRWRAMPRSLGERHLWVNVAAFRLRLIDKGATLAERRIIVGKVKTPTPQFSAQVSAVTINPWWTIPTSIVAESVGQLVRTRPAVAARRGYVVTYDANGRATYRQKPGPANALGQIKLEMPNPYSVFIHDTPSRSLFEKEVRAFSHGCIRMEQPKGIALSLLGPATDPARIDALLQERTNRTLRLDQAVPVHIVYFTAEPDPARPGEIVYHSDIYGRDAQIIAARQKAEGVARVQTECSGKLS